MKIGRHEHTGTTYVTLDHPELPVHDADGNLIGWVPAPETPAAPRKSVPLIDGQYQGGKPHSLRAGTVPVPVTPQIVARGARKLAMNGVLVLMFLAMFVLSLTGLIVVAWAVGGGAG